MRPVLCAITDRRRWGVAVEALPSHVGALARAGVDLVQVRERDLEGGALVNLVSATVAAVRGTRTRVIVSDRLDVALAAGAHGVHLRGDSAPAARVRAIVPPGFLVGRSVHAVDEGVAVARAGGLDYLLFGTVFETDSKPGRAAAGLEPLTRLIAAVRLPVLAIGGMSLDQGRVVRDSGAAGVAAVRLFGGADPAAAASAARRAFDSAWGFLDNLRTN